MISEAAFGTQVLRVDEPQQVSRVNEWVHDAYLEDAVEFSAEARRVVLPFAQESAWGYLHPSMPDPKLLKTTVFARHYEVPLTRCYLVVEHAESLEVDIDWGLPSLLNIDLSESLFRLRTGSPAAGVTVSVSEVDVRLFVSNHQAGRLHRTVLRGWRIQSDRWLARPS